MITRALERALISGKGRLVNHMHAIGQVGKIVVPKHNFIIIHQVTLYPFVTEQSIDLDTDRLDEGIFSIYEFSNQDQSIRNGFIVKNSPYLYERTNQRPYIVNSQPVQYDTYMVFEEDCYIQVGKFAGVHVPDLNYGTLLQSSQVPNPPSGYSNTPGVLTSIAQPDNVYKPAGDDAPDPTFTPGPGLVYGSQPYPTYGTGASGSIPPSNFYNSNNPCANIQYVVLNEVMRKDFQ